jgi:hypothetical protein
MSFTLGYGTKCFFGQNSQLFGITGTSLNIGEVWYITDIDAGDTFCVEILGEDTGGTIVYTANTIYSGNESDCVACYKDNGFSLYANNCNNSDEYILDIQSEIFVDERRKVIKVEISGDTLCLNPSTYRRDTGIEYILLTEYDTCYDCINVLPRSANTEQNICLQICDLSGGTTVVSVATPHPIWTNGYGGEVTQLNAVTLGGMYGLNW